MSNVQLSSGDTALAERADEGDDEFALDVRVVVAHSPLIVDCSTDDGCGNTRAAVVSREARSGSHIISGVPVGRRGAAAGKY
ncbi:MAG: FxLD family lanthipeptide [Pseudonocardiaceae bacterium]